MYPVSLREFLEKLEQAGQLARVAVEVDPYLELATIVNQVNQLPAGGPALLFPRVKGATLPVTTNLLATRQRVAWAIGTNDLGSVAARFAAELQATGCADPGEALALLVGAAQWQPRVTASPPADSWSGTVSTLADLPHIKAWPGDGGAYLTMAQVHTRHPESGALNCGMYRVQLHAPQTATVRFRQGSDAAQHLQAWHARGKAMPVTLVLGGPPVLTWAAGLPLPAGVAETAFCGYLCRHPLVMNCCQTNDLPVPAEADIIIEGEIAPGAFLDEGPFGNHTGGYDMAAATPLLRVLSVRAREQALFPWTLVGPPPQENIAMAQAAAELLLPLVQLVTPTLRRLHMPAEGIFHQAACVTLDPVDNRPLCEVAGELWRSCLLKRSRLLVVGIDDHDPHDASAVFWRVLNRVEWSRDLLIENGQMVIDARRLPATGVIQTDPQILARVLGKWREYQL